MKKVMGKWSSLFTGNIICNLLCEKSQDINFDCTIRATHARTWKYLWYEDGTTAEMTSDNNDTIVDTDDNHYEVKADQNHNCVGFLAFEMKNTQDSYYTNECEELLGEIELDDIVACAALAKPRKLISAEHLRKVWHINLESGQKTLNMTA